MKIIVQIVLFLIATVNCYSQSSDDFFNASYVHHINLIFAESNYWDSLTHYKEIDDQTGVEHYLHANVIINNDTVNSVGIRLRGNSSYGHPGNKKPIQIDFNEFVDGQQFYGLKKLNLNNHYLDPSQLREKLFLDILNAEGMQAPRCTFAAVYINYNYIGLYTALETINSNFLDDHFGNKNGNLYKCEPDMPLTWEGLAQTAYYDNCELVNNDSINDWSDLIDLIQNINFSSTANFVTNINQVFNTQSYIKSWAANNLFGNLDSYLYLPHNYFLYHNTTSNKFEWITWDVSLAFGVYATLIVPESKNFDIEFLPDNAQTTRPLNYFCLNTSFRQDYLNNICHFMKTSFHPAVLFPRIDSIANVIRTYVQSEPTINQMFSINEFENNLNYTTVNYQLLGQIPGLKSFVQQRRNSVSKQLCEKFWSCYYGQVFTGNTVFNMYPNPGSQININLLLPSEFSTNLLSIYNLSGQNVYNLSLTSDGREQYQTLTLNNLSNGIYIVKVETGCKTDMQKLIVIK